MLDQRSKILETALTTRWLRAELFTPLPLTTNPPLSNLLNFQIKLDLEKSHSFKKLLLINELFSNVKKKLCTQEFKVFDVET